MYRLQVFDRNTTGMHWHIHKDGSHYFQEYRQAGKRMPVAVAIGTDPAATYAATAPLPRGVDEMLLAGFIRRKPVPMVRCLTVDLEVPAEAEFVLEGYVDPDERRIEGPFGDHTGYYSLVGEYPVFHVTAITHRRSPVYAATIVGRPPDGGLLARQGHRADFPAAAQGGPSRGAGLLAALGRRVPQHHGGGHRKEYPGHARRIMSALWGQGQMSFSKAAGGGGCGHRPDRAPAKVFETILDEVDLESDVYITEGVLDVLDHSAPEPLFGAKMGIDATRRRTGKRPGRAGGRRPARSQRIPGRDRPCRII